ncbi:MAG: rhamnulokinase [Actinobacteria bacterium]|nr:rhamnulokinase [Actinomycetota bacterium]
MNFLAFDLGAESGRAILAIFDGKKFTTEEIDRFFNEPVLFNGTLYWDVLRLMFNVKNGIGKAAKLTNGKIDCIGVDTWGVDFGLIARDGSLVQNPVHYRDKRTVGQSEKVLKKVPLEVILSETGYQIFEVATLFQLNYLIESKSWIIDVADKLLMMPDLINYYLTGSKFGEYTDATTSGMFNSLTMSWSSKIIEPLGIPQRIFPEVIKPGTKVGELSAEVVDDLGIKKIPVVAPATHDTASAVSAVPFTDLDSAYVSSGTWSVFGVEVEKPIFDEKAFGYNFTNEGGVADRILFVKNLTGLWVLQNCRREWQKQLGKELSWEEVVRAAERAKPLSCFINIDHESFFRFTNMTKAVSNFCKNTGQVVPEDMSSIARCCIESLAMKYKETYLQLVDVFKKPIKRLHIIGGGSRNRILCQSTADALGIPVLAGPGEATALGNVSLQAIGIGEISDISEARKIISNSGKLIEYEPGGVDRWEEAYKRYKKI